MATIYKIVSSSIIGIALLFYLITFLFTIVEVFAQNNQTWVIRLVSGIYLPDNDSNNFIQLFPYSNTKLNMSLAPYNGQDISKYLWNNLQAECYFMGVGWNDMSTQSPTLFLEWPFSNIGIMYTEIPGWLTSVLPIRLTLSISSLLIAIVCLISLVFSIILKNMIYQHFSMIHNMMVKSILLITSFSLLGGTNFQTYAVLFAWPAVSELYLYISRMNVISFSAKKSDKREDNYEYAINGMANSIFLYFFSMWTIFGFIIAKMYDYGRSSQLENLSPNMTYGINGYSQAFIWVFAIFCLLIDPIMNLFVSCYIVDNMFVNNNKKVEKIYGSISSMTEDFFLFLVYYTRRDYIKSSMNYFLNVSTIINLIAYFVCVFLAYKSTIVNSGLTCSYPEPTPIIIY